MIYWKLVASKQRRLKGINSLNVESGQEWEGMQVKGEMWVENTKRRKQKLGYFWEESENY